MAGSSQSGIGSPGFGVGGVVVAIPAQIVDHPLQDGPEDLRLICIAVVAPGAVDPFQVSVGMALLQTAADKAADRAQVEHVLGVKELPVGVVMRREGVEVIDFGAGEPDAVARAEDALGERAQERFRLSDAQWAIAQEHGFRTWAEFAHWVETREPEPPVGRIGREPVVRYEERARTL